MKYAYASKTGHVEKIVGKLGLDALKIVDGTEKIDGHLHLRQGSDPEARSEIL